MDERSPMLVCMVGLPRAGKTTAARTLKVPIVQPDAIRIAIHGARFIASAEPFVWACAKTMVRALFLAGHPLVVLDATNLTIQRRLEWVGPFWATRFWHIPTSEHECLVRAYEALDADIADVIRRMAPTFEPLVACEQPFVRADVASLL